MPMSYENGGEEKRERAFEISIPKRGEAIKRREMKNVEYESNLMNSQKNNMKGCNYSLYVFYDNLISIERDKTRLI